MAARMTLNAKAWGRAGCAMARAPKAKDTKLRTDTRLFRRLRAFFLLVPKSDISVDQVAVVAPSDFDLFTHPHAFGGIDVHAVKILLVHRVESAEHGIQRV